MSQVLNSSVKKWIFCISIVGLTTGGGGVFFLKKKSYRIYRIPQQLVPDSEPHARISEKIMTLHRIASENVACLSGCRIAGEHIIDTAGHPDSLGRFIARAMLDDAIGISKDVVEDTNPYTSRYRDYGRAAGRDANRPNPFRISISYAYPQFEERKGEGYLLLDDLVKTREEFGSSGILNRDTLDGHLDKLRSFMDDKVIPMIEHLHAKGDSVFDKIDQMARDLIEETKQRDPFLGNTLTLEEAKGYISSGHTSFRVYARNLPRLKSRLDILSESWDSYKGALYDGKGFIISLNKKESDLPINRRLGLKRIFGFGFFAVLTEYFFAEPFMAATLDDFAAEGLDEEEYNAFYDAVRGRRDHLLRGLEATNTPEVQELAQEFRELIEDEELVNP